LDWELDPAKMSWDRRCTLLFGLPPGSFGGGDVDFLDLLHSDDRRRVAGELAAALERSADFDSEFRVIWPSDATVHILRSRAQVTCDAQGKATRSSVFRGKLPTGAALKPISNGSATSSTP